jgi:hypothetical protein
VRETMLYSAKPTGKIVVEILVIVVVNFITQTETKFLYTKKEKASIVTGASV